ncbi:MAG: hypothetical protein RLP44_29670 [Aggregatilineales bacterium]
MANPTDTNPWHALEEQAYHAYREWRLFLKLRLNQLRAHLPPEMFEDESASQPESKDTEDTRDDLSLLREYGLLMPEDNNQSET